MMARYVEANSNDFPEAAKLRRSAIVDGVLKVGAYSTLLGGLVAPNIVQALDKPLRQLDKTLDQRQRRREVMKTMYYMKAQGYLVGDYEHGLELTAKARRRLQKIELEQLIVRPTAVWDHTWRIIVYDIPQPLAPARHALVRHLRRSGCFQLQKSTWITPFDCRETIEAIAVQTKLAKHITFFEAHYLAHESVIVRRFARKYPMTDFGL